jgi:hypothetical protein
VSPEVTGSWLVEQEVKREKRELQRARERAARRARNASKNLGNAGLPKIFGRPDEAQRAHVLIVRIR